MGLGNLLKKAALSDDDVKAAAFLGNLAKKAGKGVAGAGLALSDKLKNKDNEEETVVTSADVVQTEAPAPIAEPSPIAEPPSIVEPSYEQPLPYEPMNTAAPAVEPPAEMSVSSSSGGYTLDMSKTTVRCPECGAVADSKAEKCPYCACQIAGNPNARSGPL